MHALRTSTRTSTRTRTRTRLAAAVVALIVLPSVSSAQARFGTLLGATVTKLEDFNPTGDNTIGNALRTKSRAGFQVGGYLQLPLSGGISLQPEVHYIQKGTKLEVAVTDPNDPINGALSIKLGYVEVPILLRADLGSRGLHPFVVAGPSFAIRTSCKLGVTGSNGSASLDVETACDDDGADGTGEDPIKKTDVGGIVGVGLTSSLVGRSFSAQFRYSRGFTTVATDASIDGAAVKPKNSGFSVVLGIGF